MYAVEKCAASSAVAALVSYLLIVCSDTELCCRWWPSESATSSQWRRESSFFTARTAPLKHLQTPKVAHGSSMPRHTLRGRTEAASWHSQLTPCAADATYRPRNRHSFTAARQWAVNFRGSSSGSRHTLRLIPRAHSWHSRCIPRTSDVNCCPALIDASPIAHQLLVNPLQLVELF